MLSKISRERNARDAAMLLRESRRLLRRTKQQLQASTQALRKSSVDYQLRNPIGNLRGTGRMVRAIARSAPS